MIAMNRGSGFKTKKSLKETGIGRRADAIMNDPSIFGDGSLPEEGQFAVVGPHAYERRWYATVFVSGGVITKVT